ncbi:MAG: hypothetical protein KIG59_07735, partial [Muribaculaceae bacterium]|nr:hypothetical protein [Muribaculaceae bacterium]
RVYAKSVSGVRIPLAPQDKALIIRRIVSAFILKIRAKRSKKNGQIAESYGKAPKFAEIKLLQKLLHCSTT